MQTRTGSLLEQLARVTVNFVACSALSCVWLPLHGLPVRVGQSVLITAPYVLVSLAVGYGLRRVFENHGSRRRR